LLTYPQQYPRLSTLYPHRVFLQVDFQYPIITVAIDAVYGNVDFYN